MRTLIASLILCLVAGCGAFDSPFTREDGDGSADDLLWFDGFYVARGCVRRQPADLGVSAMCVIEDPEFECSPIQFGDELGCCAYGDEHDGYPTLIWRSCDYIEE